MASARKTFLVIFCLVFNGRTFCRGLECAEFQVKQINISDDSAATVTFTVKYKPECFASYNPVNNIIVERVKGKLPELLCQIFVDEKESCSGSHACTCSRSPENAFINIYSVTYRVENPDDETWSLQGILRNGEPFFKSVRIEEWIATTSLVFPVTSAAVKSEEVASEAAGLDPKEDQFPLLVVILSVSLATAVVVIIVIAVVLICRRRQRSQGQVNQMPVEMAAVYSPPDPDVGDHHYRGLPRNLQAPTHDAHEENGDDNEHDIYIDIDDIESRPESSYYTEPREMSLCNRAPEDYLLPVASAQERL